MRQAADACVMFVLCFADLKGTDAAASARILHFLWNFIMNFTIGLQQPFIPTVMKRKACLFVCFLILRLAFKLSQRRHRPLQKAASRRCSASGTGVGGLRADKLCLQNVKASCALLEMHRRCGGEPACTQQLRAAYEI